MDLISKMLGREPRHEKVTAPSVSCMFSASERPAIDYTEKANRADAVNYRAIGSTTYGSGQPPVIYDKAISAIQAYPIVYGCVTAISEAISSLQVKVYEIKGAERVEALDHPFYQLFSRPNPYQGSYEFLEELQMNLDIMGNVFIAIEKGAGTSTGLELYILDPKYVALIPDPKIKVKEYRYYINGNVVKYKPEEIIHIKYSHIDDPYYGMPPLNAATEILKVEKSRVAYANQFFTNNAIPSGVLETDSNLGETLLKKLRRDWYSLHRGIENSHNIAVLQGGLKYKAISSPLSELDFRGLKDITKEDILTIYKVPESILGNQAGTGSAEGTAALTAFWRGCIVPRLRRIESALNRGLSAQVFGNGTHILEFNLKNIEALQEDKVEQGKYLQAAVGSSIMTPNEARMILGLPQSSDKYADQLLVSNSFFGNSLMPAEAAASAASAGGAGTTQEKPSTKPNKN